MTPTPVAAADHAQPLLPTILVVDDERGPRESLKLILNPSYRVLLAHDGAEGLQAYESQAPDVIISDIRMPRMDGIELMHRVRERSTTTPFVLITGYGTLESAQDAVRNGAFDYISKPFDVSQIREVVDRAVRQTRESEHRRQAVDMLKSMNRQLQEQLQALERKATLGDLSAELVHDLNNPLSILQGYVSLLEDSLVGHAGTTEEERGFVDAIRKQIERCTTLTRGFLDYSRKPTRNWELANLNHIVRDTLFLLRLRMRALRVSLHEDLAPLLPEAWVQRSALQQVLYNVALNALQAMEKDGGWLTVTTAYAADPRGGAIEVAVQDSGPGIPPEIQEHVFDPFFTTKPPPKGTGLGLSICKRVVEEHAGTITVSSKPGRGATFRIRIPLRSTPPTEATVPAA